MLKADTTNNNKYWGGNRVKGSSLKIHFIVDFSDGGFRVFLTSRKFVKVKWREGGWSKRQKSAEQMHREEKLTAGVSLSVTSLLSRMNEQLRFSSEESASVLVFTTDPSELRLVPEVCWL